MGTTAGKVILCAIMRKLTHILRRRGKIPTEGNVVLGRRLLNNLELFDREVERMIDKNVACF